MCIKDYCSFNKFESLEIFKVLYTFRLSFFSLAVFGMMRGQFLWVNLTTVNQNYFTRID